MSKHPTRWQKGQSGNPSGRPSKGAEIRRNLMEMTPQAVKAILAGIESGDATCLKIWAKAMMKKHNTTDESFDTLVIRAIMDEISGDKPEGTSEELERRFHKRTGYTFPASDELKQLFSQEA